jgi:cell division protein FtsW (lipid II flippase)
MADNRHPGINMHNLPVGGGIMGILFAIGSAVIFLLGFPTLWYFVAFSAGLGVAVAAIIHFVHVHRSDRNKPLSIMTVEKSVPRSRARRQRWHRIFQMHPAPNNA